MYPEYFRRPAVWHSAASCVFVSMPKDKEPNSRDKIFYTGPPGSAKACMELIAFFIGLVALLRDARVGRRSVQKTEPMNWNYVLKG